MKEWERERVEERVGTRLDRLSSRIRSHPLTLSLAHPAVGRTLRLLLALALVTTMIVMLLHGINLL
jgi:hypothetical protein